MSVLGYFMMMFISFYFGYMFGSRDGRRRR